MSLTADQFLNGLVLGHALGAVGAVNRLHMALALFDMTLIPSFFSHLGSEELRELNKIFDIFYL